MKFAGSQCWAHEQCVKNISMG